MADANIVPDVNSSHRMYSKWRNEENKEDVNIWLSLSPLSSHLFFIPSQFSSILSPFNNRLPSFNFNWSKRNVPSLTVLVCVRVGQVSKEHRTWTGREERWVNIRGIHPEQEWVLNGERWELRCCGFNGLFMSWTGQWMEWFITRLFNSFMDREERNIQLKKRFA